MTAVNLRAVKLWWARVPSPVLVMLALSIGILLTIARRPSVVTYPQLWAEDGRVFFLQAYQMGFWSALFHPYAGYLQLVPRLAVGMSSLLPFTRLPLVLNSIGLIIEVSPAAFILSDRWTPIIPRRELRALCALLYLALPDTSELDASVTNAQWHLAVLACLIVLAPRATSQGGRLFDYCALGLSGLSGPFALFLLPVAVILSAARKTAGQVVIAAIVAATAAIEALALLLNGLGQASGSPHLAFSIRLLLQALLDRVFLVPLVGDRVATGIAHSGLLSSSGLDALILAVLISMSVALSIQASLEARLALLFSALVLTGSLIRLVGVLPLIVVPDNAARYFYIPMLGWWLVVGLLLYQLWRRVSVRPLTIAVIAMVSVAIVSSWEYPSLPRSHFYRYAAVFERARPGAVVFVPENPASWSFTVTKR